MGNPDMRIPIAHALAWPDRFESGATPLNIFGVGRMDFEEPNLERFPCLRLAYEAIAAGGTMPAVLNAANECAVEAFLDERIHFTDIAVVIERCMQSLTAKNEESLEVILDMDNQARLVARLIIEELAK
jgi:1-deoxy-D-xylulose-5-phosphate reductoisomerase